MSLELVVARYQEELNWLRRVPKTWRITVYDKSAAPEPGGAYRVRAGGLALAA